MYSGGSDQRRWTLPAVLEEQAARRGDQPFVSMVDGATLTYRALRDDACRVAGMLAEHGVTFGDHVAIMLPSGLDFLRAWAAVGRLGAVAVHLNTELTGAFLAHPLVDAAPSILIIHADYLARLNALRDALPSLRIITVGGDDPTPSHTSFETWRSAPPLAACRPGPADLACIMYTSGTTGPPKGVLMPHAHCFLFGYGVIDNLRIDETDRYYVCLPLSHANGLLMQLGAVLISGATATVRERFSASAWLDDIRSCGATVTHSLGAISAFVTAQPATTHDRDHKLRLMFTAPNHPDHERSWRDRFGIPHVVGGYGMTEVNIPLYGDPDQPRPGTCGRPYDRFFEVEIRDPEDDRPVAVGEVGEIMVRPRMAQGFMAGYHNLSDKTVTAWRNLWFHTGDAARMDSDGYVTFVDRIKDCIRRRGENISAADIENALLALPGVAEVAAYAVPSDLPGGEDEIMCAIVLEQGAMIDAGEIIAFAGRHIPRFAQPRFLSFMPDMPKTGTEKVKKEELRQLGVTASTFDLDLLRSYQSA